MVTGAQTKIYIESELSVETEEHQNVSIISGKYTITNLIVMSDMRNIDSDND